MCFNSVVSGHVRGRTAPPCGTASRMPCAHPQAASKHVSTIRSMLQISSTATRHPAASQRHHVSDISDISDISANSLLTFVFFR